MSESGLSVESQELRNVTATIKVIEAIQLAEVRGQDLDKGQKEMKALAVLNYQGSLAKWRSELKLESKNLFGLLQKVYLYPFSPYFWSQYSPSD